MEHQAVDVTTIESKFDCHRILVCNLIIWSSVYSCHHITQFIAQLCLCTSRCANTECRIYKYGPVVGCCPSGNTMHQSSWNMAWKITPSVHCQIYSQSVKGC